MSDDKLVERLTGEPENIVEQLRAMAGLCPEVRARHRFDEYLLAAANIIAAQPERASGGEIERLRGWVEDAYLEGYAEGMCAGGLVNREDDWTKSKACAALTSSKTGAKAY